MEKGASDTTEWNETEKGDQVDGSKSEVLKLVSFPVLRNRNRNILP
jgi:hypothetical protein